MDTITEIEYTIAIVTGLSETLQVLGIKPDTEKYAICKDVFAKSMGRALAAIQLQKITKQVEKAQPIIV